MCAMPSAPTLEGLGAEPDPLVGRVINDRYKIMEAVGHGGMGRVYRAIQAPLIACVALKMLSPGHTRAGPRLLTSASSWRPVVTAGKLTHPNTITLFDYGRTDEGSASSPWSTCGRTLHRPCRRKAPCPRRVPPHRAADLPLSGRRTALGIIHRDLKPANVMLMRRGTMRTSSRCSTSGW